MRRELKKRSTPVPMPKKHRASISCERKLWGLCVSVFIFRRYIRDREALEIPWNIRVAGLTWCISKKVSVSFAFRDAFVNLLTQVNLSINAAEDG